MTAESVLTKSVDALVGMAMNEDGAEGAYP